MTREIHSDRSFGKMEFGGVSRSEDTILISLQSILGVRVKIAFLLGSAIGDVERHRFSTGNSGKITCLFFE